MARNTPLHTQFREKVPLILGYVGVQEYQGEILILADPGVCRVRKRTKTHKARLKMAEPRRTDYLKLDMIERALNRNTYYVSTIAVRGVAIGANTCEPLMTHVEMLPSRV